MGNEGLVSTDKQHIIQASTDMRWLTDSKDTLEIFVHEIQGQKPEVDQYGMVGWVEDDEKPRMINAKGANFVRGKIKALFEKHGMTANLTAQEIKNICVITGSDLIRTLIIKADDYEMDDTYILPLKNDVLAFVETALSKSKDAKVLDVIRDVTQQRINQTSIQKDEKEEKKGIFGRWFK